MTPASYPDDVPISTIEARMDGRMSSMEATFTSFTRLMDERQKAADERHRASESAADERHKASDARMDRMESMLAEMRTSIASLRITIVVTGVSSVLTAVLGISALNSALYANMLAAMNSGKEMAAIQAEVRRQVEETAVLLKKSQAAQEAPKPDKPNRQHPSSE